MWVVTPHIKHILGGFHQIVARNILGKIPWRRKEATWEYNCLGDAMRALVIEDIKNNISRWKKTVARYVSTCLILYLCLYVERRPE